MEKHNLVNEFPQHKQKIHDLKMNDQHFKKIFDEYENVDIDIHRIETGAEITKDEVLNGLRMKRVHLKDQISDLLNLRY
ncbi:MAG: DUF465 domain-containing protein [Bacteroidia bacterium]|nr:DUF465 domain-containing protein [Bacteroidia bacterium]